MKRAIFDGSLFFVGMVGEFLLPIPDYTLFMKWG